MIKVEGDYPLFIGQVLTCWDENTGRDMILVEEFTFRDKAGVFWNAPIGSVINGASIPRVLWTALSSPFCGQYRRASVIHDVFCQQKNRPHKAVHKMFYEAMLCSGVSPFKAKIMYAAVRFFGPKWKVSE